MNQVDIVMCAGFSPSARMVRKALRKVAEKRSIRVLTPCPSGAGLVKFQEELKALDLSNTLVVEGCDGCCAMQNLIPLNVTPTHLVIMDKVVHVDDKAVAVAEQKILKALAEMGK
jgi:hypothetical protein